MLKTNLVIYNILALFFVMIGKTKPMATINIPLHTKVHKWLDSFGFHLNGTQTNSKSNVTINHYFFETFNLFEKSKNNDIKNSKFLCFDAYGETIKVKSLLDLQTAFFENISQL